MNAGERLIGEHEGLQVDPDGGGALGTETLHPPNAGAHPTLTATNADVIDLDDGNELRGLNIDPQGTGGGIAGATGDTGGATIDDVNVIDTGTPGTQPGLELDGTTGHVQHQQLHGQQQRDRRAAQQRRHRQLRAASTITITTAGAGAWTPTGTTWARARSTRSPSPARPPAA